MKFNLTTILENPKPRDKQFFCPIDGCTHKFGRNDHLQTHLKNVHEKFKKDCSVCQKKYHPAALKKHQDACKIKNIGGYHLFYEQYGNDSLCRIVNSLRFSQKME